MAEFLALCLCVADLGSERYAVREATQRRLERAGWQGVLAVRLASSEDAEVRRRGRIIIRRQTAPDLAELPVISGWRWQRFGSWDDLRDDDGIAGRYYRQHDSNYVGYDECQRRATASLIRDLKRLGASPGVVQGVLWWMRLNASRHAGGY